MSLFYRVEDENKFGPYHAQDYRPCLQEFLHKKFNKNEYEEQYCYDKEYVKNHPTPQNDPLLLEIWNTLDNDINEYYFGFENLDQVFNWFCLKEEQEYLYNFNFKISVYEISEKKIDIYKNCYHGKWQSIARKDCLSLVESIEF